MFLDQKLDSGKEREGHEEDSSDSDCSYIRGDSYALAGGNPAHKVAIHVKAHPTSCTKAYPVFTTCSSIVHTWAAQGDLDVMPVFYDLASVQRDRVRSCLAG